MTLPAILMIHGMWSRASTFAQLRPELEAVGIRSAAVTLPHHDVPPGCPAPAGPVSYTHLDVYKRQEVCCLKAITGCPLLRSAIPH